MRATKTWLVIVSIMLAFSASPAISDSRVDELAKALTSSSEKTRLSAVAALARLNDKGALKPLVSALTDPNAQIRALAASALGSLGHKAALPALRVASTDDNDKVRTAAKAAVKAISKANGLVDETAPAPATKTAARAGRPGFGHQPRKVENRPDLYVAINSASDDSPGKHDKAARKSHGEILKRTLTTALTKSGTITMTASEGTRWNLDLRQVDLSVVKLDVVSVDANLMEVEAQLRLAVSDHKGKMLSFVSGGVKVQVAKRTFTQAQLPNLRKEALEGAMTSLVDKLIQQLRRPNA